MLIRYAWRSWEISIVFFYLLTLMEFKGKSGVEILEKLDFVAQWTAFSVTVEAL